MAMRKSGSAITLPPAPKAGATAKQIKANTKQVRKAISKKEKEARAAKAAKEALAENKKVRKEFSRGSRKTKSRKA